MNNIEKIVLDWYQERYDDEYIPYCEENIVEICSDEVHNHKWVTYSTVFEDKNTGKFYKAWTKRTDNGYWSDSEIVDEGCHEVFPKQITKTIYVAKEKE